MLTCSNNFVHLAQLKTISMPRQARKTSGTGIYHVMLRGINRQDMMQSGSRIQTTGPNNGHQLRDYSKSSNRSENRPLILYDYHGFPSSVEAFEKDGLVKKIIGGDEKERLLLEIRGSYKGKDGSFQFIKEQNGEINHRLFVPYKK